MNNFWIFLLALGLLGAGMAAYTGFKSKEVIVGARLHDYKVVMSASKSEFEVEVNDLLDKGYMFQGPFIITASKVIYYGQAMVKHNHEGGH